jgi:hypothetical protein
MANSAAGLSSVVYLSTGNVSIRWTILWEQFWSGPVAISHLVAIDSKDEDEQERKRLDEVSLVHNVGSEEKRREGKRKDCDFSCFDHLIASARLSDCNRSSVFK